MKKTFLTSKNREELFTQMNYLKNNYKNLYMEKELYPIRFIQNDKIRISNGRAMTYWRLDFENQGEITAKRCMVFNDWFLIISLAIIDIIFAYLIFRPGLTIVNLVLFLILVSLEVLPLYYLYVTSPLKKITNFLKKYMSIYE